MQSIREAPLARELAAFEGSTMVGTYDLLDGAPRALPPATVRDSRALVYATGVRKSYAAGAISIEILHGISMQVFEGEIVAVMGPSGSGKSTLLYCLAGLEPASSGQVMLNGVNLAETTKAQLAIMRRTDVGFVFQSYNLLPTLTAEENVALPYLLSGTRPPAGLIEQTLQTVGLAERSHLRPPALSGGEQQRVALARVLAQRPRVLFADEPTGALDSQTGDIVLDELVRIAHQPGSCALVVTHDPKVAARCDRVLFCRDGLLVEELPGGDVGAVASVLASLAGKAD